LTCEAIGDERAEWQRKRSRQHAEQPDYADRRCTAPLVGPDREPEERSPLNHEEAAPGELETPEVAVAQDAGDGADLVGEGVLKTPDPPILPRPRVLVSYGAVS